MNPGTYRIDTIGGEADRRFNSNVAGDYTGDRAASVSVVHAALHFNLLQRANSEKSMSLRFIVTGTPGLS